MRDINRIEPFMNELAQIWKRSAPDMRFAQFMLNVFAELNAKGIDPFYYEDERFLDCLAEIEWIKID